MSLSIEPLTDPLFPAFREFAERVWDRPRAEEYYRWRYRDAPDRVTLVAHQDGKLLAAISAFRRPYCFGGQRIECLETFDWSCLPELRGSGVGIRVMKALMDLGSPMVALGGSPDSLALFPQLGFKEIATGYRYILPFSGALMRSHGSRGGVGRAMIAAGLDVAGPLFFRRRARASASRAFLIPLSALDEFAGRLDEPPGLRGLPYRPHLEWLTRGFPALGWFLSFGFVESGRNLGWALARLYKKSRTLFSVLLDLRYSEAGAPHLTGMVRSVVGTLCGMGAESIVTTTTCPLVGAALRRNRFLRREAVPALVWPAAHQVTEEAARLSLMRGDDAALPLPTAAEYSALFAQAGREGAG